MVDTTSSRVPEPLHFPPRYRLGAELGRGASAVVYEALDTVLGRTVAIKVLRSEGAARFRAEAEMTSQLEHPFIVPVHDFGTLQDGRPYIVMKRVRGRTLREVLDAGDDAPLLRRLRVVQQIVEAVAFAHELGVVHRDLKPENVMLDEHGQTLVMDWGLVAARPTGQLVTVVEKPRTLDGAFLGTPGYVPPEAYRGAPAGPSQDVFALGVVIWEALVGRWPWRGRTLAELAFEATLAPPPPDDLDPDLREVLARCLEPDPVRRFPSATPLSRALQDVTEGTARRARAAAHLDQAAALMGELERLEDEAAEARASVKALEDALPGWRPLEDRLPLHETRENAEALDVRVSEVFGSLVSAAERALTHDPGNARARNLLARAWWRRFEQAERDRDRSAMALYRQRVVALGGDAAESRLDAPGALTLQTDPAGAEVWCQRVHQQGLVWPLSEAELLGHTPLHSLELPQGSYQLTLRAPGKRDTPYPVLIERGEHHEVVQPIRLLTDEEIGGEGFVYVPGGWTWVGGDPEVGRAQLPRARVWVDGFVLQRRPVTVAEYGRFLHDLHQRNPDEARARLPRHDAVEHGRHQPYWLLNPDGSLPDPLTDNEGDVWLHDWPVVGIDWHDARAYCAWTGGSLPSEHQWERAFRGADARRFPWGDHFDANLCWMGWSFRRGRSPRSVFEKRGDVSVFGAWHGAGLVREWTAGEAFDGDDTRAAIRGGGWSSTLRAVRLANRYGLEKSMPLQSLGLRSLHAERRETWPS